MRGTSSAWDGMDVAYSPLPADFITSPHPCSSLHSQKKSPILASSWMAAHLSDPFSCLYAMPLRPPGNVESTDWTSHSKYRYIQHLERSKMILFIAFLMMVVAFLAVPARMFPSPSRKVKSSPIFTSYYSCSIPTIK